MASKAEAEKVRLECPLCLDNFKNATLLSCGHTFCKGCLEEYDEQHNHHDHLVCPVCRQSTELGPNRVSGLTPNFSVKGVEDKINVDAGDQKASYCTLHSTVYKDIFCVDCSIFICLFCYVDTHKDHKIIKKEEMARKLREKKNTVVTKSKTTKIRIEKYATREDTEIHTYLNTLEKKVKDTFVQKVTILQENEELLLKKIDDIRKQSDEQSKRVLTNQRQQIDNINSLMAQLTDNISESSNLNTLQAYHLKCCKIENSLEQTIDIEPMVNLKQAVKSTRFCPADEKLLALGHIEQGVKVTTSSIHNAKTATGVRQNVEELQASNKIREMPAPVTRNLKIVRKVELPTYMNGMTALSQDAVVVGYGYGANCFYVSGEQKPHFRREVDDVYDISLLTDGRSVVSHCEEDGDDGTCRLLVYDKEGNQRGMKYTCEAGSEIPTLCSDQHDDIYAVNGTSQIFIFHGNNRQPTRVVPTGDIGPIQICVTKTGVMITSTCDATPSTVTVFDREGHVGTSITASDEDKYLCAAVDSQDRVLIARVRVWSDTIRLTRYTLQGLTLTEEVTFNPLKLHKQCSYGCSYMVSLTPNMIAFANDYSLYFIKLPA